MSIHASVIEQKDKSYNLLRLDLMSVVELFGNGNHLKNENNLIQSLWTTYLFAVMMNSASNPVCGVGCPCCKDFKGGEASLGILENACVKCPEFDTVMFSDSNGCANYHTVQNVRYTSQKSADTRALFDFLKNKQIANRAKGHHMYLLLNIEQKIIFDYMYFNEVMCHLAVPFSSITAIGHQGRDEKFRYVGIQIYPEVEGPIRIEC